MSDSFDSLEMGLLRNGRAFSGVFERIFMKYDREIESDEDGAEVIGLDKVEDDDFDTLFSESPNPRHCKYLDVVDDEEGDPDPELTALLHEKVVQVKQEINWYEEEQQHLEKIRLKEALSFNSLDESDSDSGGAVVSASAPLYRQKRSKHLKSTRLPYMVKLKTSPARRKPMQRQIGYLSSFTETESDRESLLGSETLGETDFEGERVAALDGDTISAATSPGPYFTLPDEAADTPLQISHPIDEYGDILSGCDEAPLPASNLDVQSGYEDVPLQTSHPISYTSDCYDIQSGYETEYECEDGSSDIESDSYSHSSYSSCSCDHPSSQPNTSQCHHQSQHEDDNLFINSAGNRIPNVNPHYPSVTCTQSGAKVQHVIHLCHQPCYSSPCDLQQVPSLNYYHQSCSVVASSSDIGISLPKSSKRPLELDECGTTDINVTFNGPQPKRLCSTVYIQNSFHA